MLEITLVALIVFGLGSLLHSRGLFALISFLGGAVLVSMGVGSLRGLKTYALSGGTTGRGGRELHPVLSGIVLSISNPYWFIWWLTIGMWYVMSAKALGASGIIAFFAGHISSDLAWYSFVSYGIHLGGRFLNTRVIKALLFTCSLFLVLFGLLFVAEGVRFLRSPLP